MNRRGWGLGLVLIALTALAGVLALAVGSTGWSGPQAWGADPLAWQIAWEVRAPRSMGAWLAGALLALSGALAQGVFRNPLADPYLLGSSSGAALGVAACLAWLGVGPASADVWVRLGVSGAAFLGSVMAVALTLVLELSAATGTAVAQAGLISFVGLVAPHLVRSVVSVTHGALMVLSCLAGGLLLLLADVLARWLIAPQELPVGVLTAVLGGSYLLWRMNRSSGGLT